MPTLEELESQAATFSQRGDLHATERVCREILRVEGNHLSSLRFLADRALLAGDFASAADHLRALIANSPGDPRLHSQLGQALYQQGELRPALAAYQECWRLRPRQRLIYLTLGCLHLELGDTGKAAQVFSLGELVDPDILSLWRQPDTSPAVARMSKSAWETLCAHHTGLHLQSVATLGEPAATARIRDAVWPLLDAREVQYQHPRHRPRIFSIKYADNPTFFPTGAFTWREPLEQEYAAIREEILTGLDLAADGRPYLRDSHRLRGEQWAPLVNRMSWASVHLYSAGVANEGVIGKFPRTLAALEKVPLATKQGRPSEVFISVLAPRTRIPEHYGVSSAILTAHLPIDVPPGCGLKVLEETRVPEPGKLMVFDDTWEHSAWNDSDRPRVVLIFELWHPQLTALEQEAISRSFQAREHWVRQRSVD